MDGEPQPDGGDTSLAARPDVDGARLALVGHDFGAMLASIVAARERRVRTAILMAPTPRWGDWFLPFWEISEPRSAYLEALEPLDPLALAGSVRGTRSTRCATTSS